MSAHSSPEGGRHPIASAVPGPRGPLIRLLGDQRVAYVLVGGLNTVVGYGVFVACSVTVGDAADDRFGVVTGTVVTLAIAHLLSVLFAFVMQRRLVFRVRGHVLRDLLRFESVYLTSLGINAAALIALVKLGVDRIPAQAIVFLPTLILNYLGHRYFSFRRSVADAHD